MNRGGLFVAERIGARPMQLCAKSVMIGTPNDNPGLEQRRGL